MTSVDIIFLQLNEEEPEAEEKEDSGSANEVRTQSAFTWVKLITKTVEQGVKYVQS